MTATTTPAYSTKAASRAPLGVSVAEAAASETVELGSSTSNAPVGTDPWDDVADVELLADEEAEALKPAVNDLWKERGGRDIRAPFLRFRWHTFNLEIIRHPIRPSHPLFTILFGSKLSMNSSRLILIRQLKSWLITADIPHIPRRNIRSSGSSLPDRCIGSDMVRFCDVSKERGCLRLANPIDRSSGLYIMVGDLRERSSLRPAESLAYEAEQRERASGQER